MLPFPPVTRNYLMVNIRPRILLSEEALPIYRLPDCFSHTLKRMCCSLFLRYFSFLLPHVHHQNPLFILPSSGWFVNTLLLLNLTGLDCSSSYDANDGFFVWCTLNSQPMEDIFSGPSRSGEMDTLLLKSSDNPDCTLRICSLQKLKVWCATHFL